MADDPILEWLRAAAAAALDRFSEASHAYKAAVDEAESLKSEGLRDLAREFDHANWGWRAIEGLVAQRYDELRATLSHADGTGHAP